MNIDRWREAKARDPAGTFREAEELSLRLALKWPEEGRLEALAREPEIGDLRRILRELPEEFRPENDTWLAIASWANSLSGEIGKEVLGRR